MQNKFRVDNLEQFKNVFSSVNMLAGGISPCWEVYAAPSVNAARL